MIQYEITKETVICADGLFQAHPESYSPRIFVETDDKEGYYEILRTGEAVVWPRLPDRFDFWHFKVQMLSDVNIVRN